MAADRMDFDKFDKLFYPEHIAFIGASEKSALGSMLYLITFQGSRWSDTFYPINPNAEKILEWKSYPSVLDVPNDIDTAYVSVKTKIVPKVIKECVEKQIPWVIIFASGFSETGDAEGKVIEKEVKDLIKNSETRIIGPNCLGPINAKNGIPFSFAAVKGIPGNVSFMSQSGGHLTQLVDIGFKRDIRFRYGVSFGNQIDLNCFDFLRHYRQDPETKVIAAYLESFGSADGHDFFLELRKTTEKKPVVIWKGGYTSYGKKAAFSHTGAIASDDRLWKSMAKQTGATIVKDNEQFWNTIKTFELLYPNYLPKGRRVGIITPGGGVSVNMTDLFSDHNLKVPEITKESQEKIQKILPKENVNVKNPIDLGATGFMIDAYTRIIEIMVDEPNIDIIILPMWPDHLYSWIVKKWISIKERTSKPLVFALPSIADSPILSRRFTKIQNMMHKSRSLYFLSLRDSANSLSLLCDYAEFLKSHDITVN